MWVAQLGVVITLIGLILVPLPGPGWFIVSIGAVLIVIGWFIRRA